MIDRIPFHRPFASPQGARAVQALLQRPELVGDGLWGRRCEEQLRAVTGSTAALLTPSATSALELGMLALDLRPGDEVILPSFTFPSCANSVALRGATPVFCDVRPDTLSSDLDCIAPCLSERTKAVMVVHYGGNVADMPPIMEWCQAHGLALIEDAAQSIGASLHGRAAGTFGMMAALSFHGTKNIGAGEAGALLVNGKGPLLDALEIHREKGTDRSRFLRGEVDKYSWRDLGSSWVVSELVSAYLSGQLECLDEVTRQRQELWQSYHDLLQPLAEQALLQRPGLTPGVSHNGHCYYILLPDSALLRQVQLGLREAGIEAPRHFVPLHLAPAGLRFGRTPHPLPVTESSAERLLRLPLWPGLRKDEQQFVVDTLGHLLRTLA